MLAPVSIRCSHCRQQCLNIISSAKFYVEPPWEGGTKVCINSPGHMTKISTMPIYDKDLSSSAEQEVL